MSGRKVAAMMGLLRRGYRDARRLRIAVIAMASLAFASIACASHQHTPDFAAAAGGELCALCVQLDRFGAAPGLLCVATVAAAADERPADPPAAPPVAAPVHAYRSRAPPA
jgi:hypothetical protein